MNPKTDLKEGQSVVLTCLVHAANVDRKNVNWYKDGNRLRENISRDRFLFDLLSFFLSYHLFPFLFLSHRFWHFPI